MENGKTTSNKNKKEVSEKSQLEAIRMQLQALLELNKQREEENKRLHDEISQLKEESNKPNYEGTVATEKEYIPTENFDANRMVEIVHLYENGAGLTTTLKLSDGRELSFRRYGDSLRVRYYEFQQLLSTYDSLFRKERIFTLGKNDQDIAEAEHLPTYDEKCLTKDEIRGLLQLPAKRLEEVYTRVCDTHKELILSAWQRGYYEGREPEYRNLDKINALNKVSGNRLRTIYENLTQPINS